MTRKLRMLGTNSKSGECPTLYEDEATGEILVQGYTVTDPEVLATRAPRSTSGSSPESIRREITARGS
ncbi:hypothetical protein [Streptomyces sp. NPDC006645]|uniref:hypothetical protein n=1 Tax=unclassified Streptomyces TaxID=2593676 RepID=UPI0033B4DF1A